MPVHGTCLVLPYRPREAILCPKQELPSEEISRVLTDIFSRVIDALLAIPGIRFIVGLVDNRLRPVWGLLLIAGTVYFLSRASHYLSLRRARETLRMDAMNTPPPSSGKSERVIATPPTEVAQESGEAAAHPARLVERIPARHARLLLIVSVGVAVVALSAAVALIRSGAAKPPVVASSQPAQSDTAFRFEDAGWRMQGNDCIATLRVTAMGRLPRHLALFVSGKGGVIGRADVNEPAMARGALVDFHIPKVNCDRIETWEVQGEFAQN